MIKIEDLNLENLKVMQDDQLYCFTSDSVLLTRFAKAKRNDDVADFCSGSGIVGFNFYGLNKNLVKKVSLFEMQKPLFELSVKSIELNGLEQVFSAHNLKIQEIDSSFNERFSLILCNPPYMKVTSGETKEKPQIAMCWSEVALTLEELINAVSKCLKFGGRFCMVHRADRLTDALVLMREFNVEPKRLQFINAKDKEPYSFLIEGVKGGKPSLKVLSPIIN